MNSHSSTSYSSSSRTRTNINTNGTQNNNNTNTTTTTNSSCSSAPQMSARSRQFGQSQNLLEQGKNINLRAMHKKTSLQHPASKNWLIHLHYVRREFETCKSIINEELSRLNGHSEYANYIMALILRSEGKMQESLDRLQICHELEPNNSNTIKQIARSLFLLGRHKLAIDAYKKAQIVSEEADSESFYNMGMCYLFMKDLDKAKENMNLSLQARVSVDAFETLGQIALTKGSINEALNIYEKAIRIFPENSAILSNLGILYMKAGKDEISFSRLSSALAFESQNPKALIAIASMMQNYEDYDFALAKYKTAMQHIPDSASLWNNIGMCFFGKKKYVAAISCLKRAYYLSPFDWKILHNLGLIHLHMQQYASAFHFLTAAINLKPEHSYNFMLLAVAISHLNDIDHAIQAYEQAIKLNKMNESTDNLTLHFNYGISLINNRKYEEAYAQFLIVDELESNGLIMEDEAKELHNHIKTAMKTMNYKFTSANEPEKPIRTTLANNIKSKSAIPDKKGRQIVEEKADLHLYKGEALDKEDIENDLV